MAWTQSDVDALHSAIASGVLSVRYAGPPMREVVYQSIDAMLKALAIAQQAVNRAAGAKGFSLASHSKGL